MNDARSAPRRFSSRSTFRDAFEIIADGEDEDEDEEEEEEEEGDALHLSKSFPSVPRMLEKPDRIFFVPDPT